MIRHVLTTKAIILVVLAAMQGLFLAALPMVNYWRTDIEALLSDRLGATVTISEIGARASWTGPYLEALDLVIQKDAGSLEVRRVQMLLDLPNTITSMQPVIGQLILDEGELIQRGSDGSGIPDPTEWAGLLDQIRNVIQPIGAFQIHNFDVLLGEFSLKRLSIDITPDVGVLAQARVVTEEISVPIDIDWRYPQTTTDAHDVRVQTRLRQALVPMLGLDEFTATVDATAWLNIRPGVPVDGTVRVTGLADQDQGLTGDLSARFELPGLSKIQASFESLQFRAPGLRIAGSGGGLTYDGKRLTASIPAIDFDGGLMGEFIRDSDPEPQLYRLLSMNQPRLSAKQVQLDWILGASPQVAATVDAFEIQAARSIPEIGPVSGQLYLDGSRGWFDFAARSATFSLPEIFPTPWSEQSLSGTLAFDRTDKGLKLRGQDLRVKSAEQDVQGALLLDLPRDDEQQMQLELTVQASTGALPGLLPLDLDDEVVDFLSRSVEQVVVDRGRISYSGPLGSEVDRTRRELSMRFPLTSYRFKPLTNWPAFRGTQGVVDFVSKRARIEFNESDFGGLLVTRVVAMQAAEDARRIDIDGHLVGEAFDALAVLEQAGVKPDALGSAVKLDGRLSGEVSLAVPIGGDPSGAVMIASEDLTVELAQLAEPLMQVTGRAEYRLNDGLYTDRLVGQLMGDPVEARVTISDGQTEIIGQGRLKTSNVARLAQLGLGEDQLFGSADWSIVGRGDDQSFIVSLETDGRGLGSRLPYPLAKDEASIGRVAVNLTDEPDGRTFSVRVFDVTDIGGVLDSKPLTLEVMTPEADLIGWATLPSGDGDRSNLSILLRTERLLLGETPLAVDKTAIVLRPQEFNVSFDGSELAGRVSRVGEGPLLIDLERMVLPEGGDLLDPPGDDPLFDYNPGELPSMKVRISTLLRGETRYEDMDLVLVSGESRLDATTLEFDRDGQRFQGELAWAYQNGQAQTALLLRAQGDELGNILRVNEDEPLLEAESGRFVSNLSWDGSPLGFSLLTSRGVVELSLKDGRFLDLGNSAEVLRLFGILNIETVTRRLRLDFLDLVQPGVAFDSVDAKARIADGQLVFDPEFTMSGPSASFRLTGEADLINEKLKQRLEVDIPLTNNLPLASVLLGAPQVGGAIYLVEKALGTKIIKVGKTDYRIEGSFAEPQVSLIPPFSKKKD